MQAFMTTLSAFISPPVHQSHDATTKRSQGAKLLAQKEDALRPLMCAPPADYIIRNCYISEYHVFEIIEKLDNFASEVQEKFSSVMTEHIASVAKELLTDLDSQFDSITNELEPKFQEYVSEYESLCSDKKNLLANELQNGTFRQTLVNIQRCIVKQERFIIEQADSKLDYLAFEKERADKLITLFPIWNLANLGKMLHDFHKNESVALLFASQTTKWQTHLTQCQHADLALVGNWRRTKPADAVNSNQCCSLF